MNKTINKIEVKFNKTQKKNLVSRRMHKVFNKMIENKVISELEMQQRTILEDFAIGLKNKGVTGWEGQNYILKII